jgi:6-methylsalicylate decarboxylase
MSRVDVHQHLWPEPFLAALARRTTAPCLVREDGGWTLRLPDEPPCRVDVAAHDPSVRAAALHADGFDRALICMSSPLGVEALPAHEARELLDAWHGEVLALGHPFGVWGAVALRGAAPSDIDTLLTAGAVGLSIPARAIATHEGLERHGALLEHLDRSGAPLLVHPGPAPGVAAAHATSDPAAWWPALTRYVAEMSAAWHAFVAWGRSAHPGLRVVFAMLAGGAPLHIERLSARGGPSDTALDPLVYYDTSSYGPRAIDALVRVVGIDQVVAGSDRPVIGDVPGGALGPAAREAMTRTNPARLLSAAPLAAVA